MGDWHLIPLGVETGEVTERLEMLAEGRLVWRLEVQVAVAGPSGLLKRLVRLGVLVGVGVSLGVSAGVDSFGVCGSIPAFLAENVGLGDWTPDRGEDTRPGEKADMGELILGCTEAEFDGYSAPLVGLRGSWGDMHRVPK